MMTQKFYAHTSDFYQISLNSTTLESAIGESQKAVQDEYRKWYETDTEYPYDPEDCTVPFRIFSENPDSDGGRTVKSILDLMSKLPKLPEGEDIRMTGTMAAVQALGMDTVTEMPVLVNFGVLKQLVGNKPPMLSMRSAASTLIHTTDLHSLPSEPPAILRTPLIVQASKARKPLFGQTLGLACYEQSTTADI